MASASTTTSSTAAQLLAAAPPRDDDTYTTVGAVHLRLLSLQPFLTELMCAQGGQIAPSAEGDCGGEEDGGCTHKSTAAAAAAAAAAVPNDCWPENASGTAGNVADDHRGHAVLALPSFVSAGVDKCLDRLQQTTAVLDAAWARAQRKAEAQQMQKRSGGGSSMYAPTADEAAVTAAVGGLIKGSGGSEPEGKNVDKSSSAAAAVGIPTAAKSVFSSADRRSPYLLAELEYIAEHTERLVDCARAHNTLMLCSVITPNAAASNAHVRHCTSRRGGPSSSLSPSASPVSTIQSLTESRTLAEYWGRRFPLAADATFSEVLMHLRNTSATASSTAGNTGSGISGGGSLHSRMHGQMERQQQIQQSQRLEEEAWVMMATDEADEVGAFVASTTRLLKALYRCKDARCFAQWAEPMVLYPPTVLNADLGAGEGRDHFAPSSPPAEAPDSARPIFAPPPSVRQYCGFSGALAPADIAYPQRGRFVPSTLHSRMLERQTVSVPHTRLEQSQLLGSVVGGLRRETGLFLPLSSPQLYALERALLGGEMLAPKRLQAMMMKGGAAAAVGVDVSSSVDQQQQKATSSSSAVPSPSLDSIFIAHQRDVANDLWALGIVALEWLLRLAYSKPTLGADLKDAILVFLGGNTAFAAAAAADGGGGDGGKSASVNPAFEVPFPIAHTAIHQRLQYNVMRLMGATIARGAAASTNAGGDDDAAAALYSNNSSFHDATEEREGSRRPSTDAVEAALNSSGRNNNNTSNRLSSSMRRGAMRSGWAGALGRNTTANPQQQQQQAYHHNSRNNSFRKVESQHNLDGSFAAANGASASAALDLRDPTVLAQRVLRVLDIVAHDAHCKRFIEDLFTSLLLWRSEERWQWFEGALAVGGMPSAAAAMGEEDYYCGVHHHDDDTEDASPAREQNQQLHTGGDARINYQCTCDSLSIRPSALSAVDAAVATTTYALGGIATDLTSCADSLHYDSVLAIRKTAITAFPSYRFDLRRLLTSFKAQVERTASAEHGHLHLRDVRQYHMFVEYLKLVHACAESAAAAESQLQAAAVKEASVLLARATRSALKDIEQQQQLTGGGGSTTPTTGSAMSLDELSQQRDKDKEGSSKNPIRNFFFGGANKSAKAPTATAKNEEEEGLAANSGYDSLFATPNASFARLPTDHQLNMMAGGSAPTNTPHTNQLLIAAAASAASLRRAEEAHGATIKLLHALSMSASWGSDGSSAAAAGSSPTDSGAVAALAVGPPSSSSYANGRLRAASAFSSSPSSSSLVHQASMQQRAKAFAQAAFGDSSLVSVGKTLCQSAELKEAAAALQMARELYAQQQQQHLQGAAAPRNNGLGIRPPRRGPSSNNLASPYDQYAPSTPTDAAAPSSSYYSSPASNGAAVDGAYSSSAAQLSSGGGGGGSDTLLGPDSAQSMHSNNANLSATPNNSFRGGAGGMFVQRAPSMGARGSVGRSAGLPASRSHQNLTESMIAVAPSAFLRFEPAEYARDCIILRATDVNKALPAAMMSWRHRQAGTGAAVHTSLLEGYGVQQSAGAAATSIPRPETASTVTSRRSRGESTTAARSGFLLPGYATSSPAANKGSSGSRADNNASSGDVAGLNDSTSNVSVASGAAASPSSDGGLVSPNLIDRKKPKISPNSNHGDDDDILTRLGGNAAAAAAALASRRGRRLLTVLREETPFPIPLLALVHAMLMDPFVDAEAFAEGLQSVVGALAKVVRRQEQRALKAMVRHSVWNRHVPIVPPSLRAMCWGKLLGLPMHDRHRCIDVPFYSINTYRPMGSDRQIAVDVPRCHQYHHLMASVDGHRKLHHVCKAWLALHPAYVYWQGVDSIAAVVLTACFNDLPLATAALGAIVDGFVPHYYNKERTMDQQMHTYTHVLTYVDPDLAQHLEQLEVKPELYTISWFLTLFAHILPCEKVYLIWDRLFRSRSMGFTVCMAVALMSQMRDGIASSDFSGCVSLLSTSALQGVIDVARAAADADVLLSSVPRTVLSPKYNMAMGALVRTSVCAMLEVGELAEAYARRADRSLDTDDDADSDSSSASDESDGDDGDDAFSEGSSSFRRLFKALGDIANNEDEAEAALTLGTSSSKRGRGDASPPRRRHLKKPHWSDAGIFLIDVRTDDEIKGRLGGSGGGGGMLLPSSSSGQLDSRSSSVATSAQTQTTSVSSPLGGGFTGTNNNKSSSSSASAQHINTSNMAIVGALHLPYDGIDGWNVDNVIQLLCNRRNLWLPALPRGDVVGHEGGCGAAATSVAPPPPSAYSSHQQQHVDPNGDGAAAEDRSESEAFIRQQTESSSLQVFLQNAPHVIIIAGKDPEAGQSAAQSLISNGTACVTMLLGGVRELKRLAPHLLVETASE